MDTDLTCPGCGEALPIATHPHRQRKTCSATCRVRLHRRRNPPAHALAPLTEAQRASVRAFIVARMEWAATQTQEDGVPRCAYCGTDSMPARVDAQVCTPACLTALAKYRRTGWVTIPETDDLVARQKFAAAADPPA